MADYAGVVIRLCLLAVILEQPQHFIHFGLTEEHRCSDLRTLFDTVNRMGHMGVRCDQTGFKQTAYNDTNIFFPRPITQWYVWR